MCSCALAESCKGLLGSGGKFPHTLTLDGRSWLEASGFGHITTGKGPPELNG
jgi:hypothetical protein